MPFLGVTWLGEVSAGAGGVWWWSAILRIILRIEWRRGFLVVFLVSEAVNDIELESSMRGS